MPELPALESGVAVLSRRSALVTPMSATMRHPPLVLLLASLVTVAAGQSAAPLPNHAGSLKPAVIGDNGTGKQPQLDVAAQMALAHGSFPFELVLMMGDNFYGAQGPDDLETKFARPYRPLLNAGVTFRAALGNHDDIATVTYPPIHMDGRYYTYARQNVRFIVLDSNVLDAPQLAWARATLQQAREQGEQLVVGVNGDASTAHKRAEMLDDLRFVDYDTLLPERGAALVNRRLRPNIDV